MTDDQAYQIVSRLNDIVAALEELTAIRREIMKGNRDLKAMRREHREDLRLILAEIAEGNRKTGVRPAVLGQIAEAVKGP